MSHSHSLQPLLNCLPNLTPEYILLVGLVSRYIPCYLESKMSASPLSFTTKDYRTFTKYNSSEMTFFLLIESSLADSFFIQSMLIIIISISKLICHVTNLVLPCCYVTLSLKNNKNIFYWVP